MKELFFLGLQILVLAVSAGLILVQIKNGIEEVSKTHDWNRRKASQDACYEFMHHPTAKCWNLIYEPLIVEEKDYFELNAEQKEAARTIMNYFENLGILIKHGIVDDVIIYDYFQSMWFRFFNASKEYVKSTQLSAGDETVFENFGKYALKFDRLNNDRNQAKHVAGTIQPKEKIV